MTDGGSEAHNDDGPGALPTSRQLLAQRLVLLFPITLRAEAASLIAWLFCGVSFVVRPVLDDAEPIPAH